MNEPTGRRYLDAADAVDAALVSFAAALENAPNWQKAAAAMPPLVDAVTAFADAVGVPYEAKDGSAVPARLVAALERAIVDNDETGAQAAMAGIRHMLGERGDPALRSEAHSRQQVALTALIAAYPYRPGQSRRGVMALSIRAAGDAPPTEFRIFESGMNRTSNGDGLFDEQAARDVIARFQKQGVDLMIDLEHQSLDEESVNFDPDARGWCKLEVRKGELWATNVSWTSDGEARLREKRQRYISPVFGFDKKTRRITNVLNIAITAMPATHKLAPLVAASHR
ncbi:MAG TPA: phage protease [Polyangiaceae bacterium]|nr:phage protease [Polyangiaceae bacterium]